MYHCHLILIIVNWMVLLSSVFASSEDLFSTSNPDDILWDPNSILAPEGSTATQSTLDDFGSDLDMINFDDNSVMDPISFANNDDENLFASAPSPNRCDAAAGASDLSLEARDSKSSCPTNPQGSSSSSSPPILSPDSRQLFEDPSSLLNNLLSPPPSSGEKKQQGSPSLSGSGEPPDPPPNDSPPSYPGHLSDEQAARKIRKEFDWDVNLMRLTPMEDDFFCTTQKRNIPVCCDGPHNVYGNLEQCDLLAVGNNAQGPFFCNKRYGACCVRYWPDERIGYDCLLAPRYALRH